MPQITLPDGSVRSFDNPVTVFEVAQSIGTGLARAALAGRVDGKLVDTTYLIENNANLGFGAANNRGLKIAKGKYIFYLNNINRNYRTNYLDYLIYLL